MGNFSNEAYYMFFSALSSRTRLAIIDVLKDGPKNASEISDALEQKQEIILHNVGQLEHCFLVRSEGTGKERRYSLSKEIVEPLSEVLMFYLGKHCPGLNECIPPKKLKAYMKEEAAKETYIEHA